MGQHRNNTRLHINIWAFVHNHKRRHRSEPCEGPFFESYHLLAVRSSPLRANNERRPNPLFRLDLSFQSHFDDIPLVVFHRSVKEHAPNLIPHRADERNLLNVSFTNGTRHIPPTENQRVNPVEVV